MLSADQGPPAPTGGPSVLHIAVGGSKRYGLALIICRVGRLISRPDRGVSSLLLIFVSVWVVHSRPGGRVGWAPVQRAVGFLRLGMGRALVRSGRVVRVSATRNVVSSLQVQDSQCFDLAFALAADQPDRV